jgi:hypothetical protein
LISFDDKETRAFVNKVIAENSYVSAILNNPFSIIDTTKTKIIHRSKVDKNGPNLAKDVKQYLGTVK